MLGTWSRGELVTEGETVKLRQQRDVTRDTSRRAASCCADGCFLSVGVDARTVDLRMAFGKINGTSKCGHYIKKKIMNIYCLLSIMLLDIYYYYYFTVFFCRLHVFYLNFAMRIHACHAALNVPVKLFQV